MARVFLSYASHDRAEALALKAWLQETEPGLADDIFLDIDPDTGIPAGIRWKEALRKANERCEAVVCLVSPEWDASYECKVEYRAAEDRGKPIFPVRLAPLAGSDITAEWQRCDLFGDGPKTTIRVDGIGPVEFVTSGLQRLRLGLRAAGIAPDSFPWPPRDEPDRAPYRGWRPLEAVDAAIYFGRDAQINRALTAVRGIRNSGSNQAFVILGPSGVGKSSFLRAGILPRVYRDDRHFLPMDIVRPQQNPLTGAHGLAHSMHTLRGRLGLSKPSLGAIKSGIGDSAQVLAWLAEAQQAAMARFIDDAPPTPPTLVLPLDQAEELFGTDAGDEALVFLDIMADLLRDSELRIIVVSTVRSDRYEPFQTAPQLVGLQAHVFDDLKPLPSDRYREVICGPESRARRAGSRLQWAPELVDQLLEECARSADALPLLSLTLARLYEDYGDGAVGPAEYHAMGGMERVVESEIEAVLSSDPITRHDELAKLHDAFIPWLATINPANDQPLRRAARMFDLPAESHVLIEKLVAKRLIVKDERDGEVVVEVALESLLRQWDVLAGWLRDRTADLKTTDAIELAARAWDDNGRRDDWLLEGARLSEAESLAAQPGFRSRLNASSEYLLASRQREDRQAEAAVRDAQERVAVAQRNSRRLRAALALVAVVAVAAVFGFGWALNARADAAKQFRDATAQRLFAESQQMLSGQRSAGSDDVAAMQMLLAARAIPSSHQGSDDQLLTALNQQRDLVKIIDVPAQVFSVAYSPDGQRIATGSGDNTVRQWDAVTGEEIGAPFTLHENQVVSVAYSPDGRRIASGSADNTVRLWNSATGEQIWEGKQDLAVTVVAFSPDGRRVASGGADSTVRLWDATTGRSIWQSAHDGPVSQLAFSPDGARLVAGSYNNTARVWDAGTGTEVGEPIRGHNAPVFGVAYSPDGTYIATGSLDGSVRLWDAGTRRPIGQPLSGARVTKVAFSPDGHRIATASADGGIDLWDVGTGQLIGELSGHRASVEYVAFSPDNRRLVSGGDDKTIRIWDVHSWQPMYGHTDIAVATFSDNGNEIRSGGFDGTVLRWDTATGSPIGPPIRVDDTTVDSLEPVGPQRLFSISEDMDGVKTYRLWDAGTRAPVGEPTVLPSSNFQQQINLSDDGEKMAVLFLGEIQVFDADTMRPVGEPIRPESPSVFFRFSPDSKILATSHTSDDDQSVRLWDVATGKPVGRPMKGNGVLPRMTFSSDGRLLSVAGTGTGQPGAEQNTLRVWDTRTFETIGDPILVDSSVLAMAISPDDHIVATGSSDGAIRFWDITSHRSLGAPYAGHTGAITSLEFSDDGTEVLTASADHTVRMWPAPLQSSEEARSALCAKFTHNMSRAQWNDLVSPEIDYIELCPGLPEADDID